MKKIIRIVSIIGLLTSSILVHSGEITDTYTTSETLTATKLNTTISAVNDNDARITTLEAAPNAITFNTGPTIDNDMNDGYTVGSVWVDTAQRQAYILVDSSPGAAVWISITPPPLRTIGDLGPAGGTVFYVTDGGLHGLEASQYDIPAAWGCYLTDIVGAHRLAIGTGALNTADIIAGCATAGIAARVADAYSLNGYNDWYLPSKEELNELYLNRLVVGRFSQHAYWSSSEWNDGNAWAQSFIDGDQYNVLKLSTPRARPIRAF